MGNIRTPLPVKLFVGILTSMPELLGEIEEHLTRVFGPIDTRSESFQFDQTRYYDEEMGRPLIRVFLSFEKMIDPFEIAASKIRTNEIEAALAERHPEVARPVNLDPGYLEQSKVVLASTKNFFHRISIAEGIYAEVTLHFQGGEWCDFPWTFPDYKSGQYHEYFRSLRDLYRRQLGAAGFQIRLRRR